jgi:hypothetical protein
MSMKTYRSDAVIVSIFFIIATSFLLIGEFFYKPILSAPDYLTTVAPNKPVVVFGILIEFICVLTIPMIAVFMFPVMKLYNESLALAYVVFRVLEAVILISVAEVNKLSLIGLSEDYLAQNAADPAMYETIGRSIFAENTWGDTAGLLYNLIFVLGALVLYVVLYPADHFRLGVCIGACSWGRQYCGRVCRCFSDYDNPVGRASCGPGNGNGALVYHQGLRSQCACDT